MKTLQIMLAAVAATLAVSACASGGNLSEREQLALYRANAKPPVESFLYLGRIDGWTPLGDEALAIWTKPREAYLLEIEGPCPDLDFADAIGLTNQSGHVYARFDKVIPRRLGGGTPQPIPCWIREIRPLDVKALKAARQAAREKAAES
jgi:Family of unknown function (DUF6491)